MSQKATECLSAKQVSAIEALAGGCTVVDAARASDVRRETIHRWLRKDHEFQGALNRVRRSMQRAIDDRLRSAAVGAANNVAKAVESGDLATSLVVLRGLGALSGKAPQIGAEDAAVLAERAVQAERDRRYMVAVLKNSSDCSRA